MMGSRWDMMGFRCLSLCEVGYLEFLGSTTVLSGIEIATAVLDLKDRFDWSCKPVYRVVCLVFFFLLVG